MRNKQPQIVNVKRAAEIIGGTPRNVLYLIVKGKLTGQQINPKCWVVDLASIERYMAKKQK